MHIDKLIEQTRDIVKTHYEGMQRLEIDSDPEIQRKDLFEQLQSFLPGMSHDDMAPLYHELESKGYAKLITNDTITFSKDFIGE